MLGGERYAVHVRAQKFPGVLARITLYAKFVQTQQLRSCTPVKVSFDKTNAFCCLLLSCECFISGGEEQIFSAFQIHPPSCVRLSIQSTSELRRKCESPSSEDRRVRRILQTSELRVVILNLMWNKNFFSHVYISSIT